MAMSRAATAHELDPDQRSGEREHEKPWHRSDRGGAEEDVAVRRIDDREGEQQTEEHARGDQRVARVPACKDRPVAAAAGAS